MSGNEVEELASVIRKHQANLERIYADLQSALRDEIVTIGRTGRSALIPAGLLENYYTCLETIMLRGLMTRRTHGFSSS